MFSFCVSVSFSGSVDVFSFVFSPSSLGDMKGLLGTFPRCDHAYR